jgi:hypothetical protein
MTMTRHGLLLLKATYLLDKPLSETDTDFIVSYNGDGTRQDVRNYVAKLGTVQKFKPLRESVEPFIFNIEALSKDEMNELIYRIAVESASLDCGIRIIRNAETKDNKKLMVYVYNLYLRDVENFEKDVNNRRKTTYGAIKQQFVYAPTTKVAITGEVDLPGLERNQNGIENEEWRTIGGARNAEKSMQPMEYDGTGTDKRTDLGPRKKEVKKEKPTEVLKQKYKPRFLYYQAPPTEPGVWSYGK